MMKYQRVSLCFLHGVIVNEDNNISFQHVGSDGNTSDVLTKPLPRAAFVRHSFMLGLRQADEF